MKPYEYRGFVQDVSETRTFPSGFAIRTLVLCEDPDAEYVDYAAFDAMKTKSKDWTKELNGLERGECVTVKFYLSANESKQKPGSWFGSARLVGLERESAGCSEDESRMPASVPTPPVAKTAAKPAQEQESDIDDLPF